MAAARSEDGEARTRLAAGSEVIPERGLSSAETRLVPAAEERATVSAAEDALSRVSFPSRRPNGEPSRRLRKIDSGEIQLPSGSREGTRLGRYRLVERIGAGGMGTVYRGHLEDAPDQVVALKILSDAVIHQPEVRKRFAREARIMASLQHPNIVAFEDFVTEREGAALVMEFADGGALSRALEDAPLPFERAAPLFRQILDALSYAHARGIVHRDIKPGNVLLGAGGQAKLTDFGVARLADATSLTRTGMGVGTPSYISPEQIKGVREVGPEADIYACGVLFHRVLAGRLPFGADTGEIYGLMQAHLSEEPPSLRSLGLDVPERVEAAVLRALAKAPEDRFPSCAAFARALGVDTAPRVLERPLAPTGEEREPRPAPATRVAATRMAPPAPRPPRSRPPLPALVAAGLTAVLAVLVASSVWERLPGEEPPVPERRADVPTADAAPTETPASADAAPTETPASAGKAPAGPEPAVVQLTLQERDVRAREARRTLAARAAALNEKGYALLKDGKYREANATFDRARALEAELKQR